MLAAEAASKDITQHLFESLKPLSGSGQHVAVAVSGGSDSLALLRLCAGLAGRLNISLTALTVDHGLRPGSSGEALQVAAWCREAGVGHVCLTWTGAKPRAGLQAAARKARYDLLTEWCRKNAAVAVLTAHTRDDQAETVQMRSRRSGSPRSIAGIWPEMSWNGVRVIRPLLEITRAALRQYLQGIGQPWIDDPSNDNMTFERVRVRKTMTATDRENLARRASEAQSSLTMLTAQADAWLASAAAQHPLGYLVLEYGQLADLLPDVRHEVLRRLIGHVSRQEYVSLSEIIRVEHWLGQRDMTGQPRRTLAGCLFARRKTHVLVTREWARIKLHATVPESGNLLWDWRFAIRAPAGSRVEPAGVLSGLQRPPDVPSYIFAGLPAVTLVDSPPIMPHFPTISGRISDIECETIEFPGRLRRLTSWNPVGGNLC